MTEVSLLEAVAERLRNARNNIPISRMGRLLSTFRKELLPQLKEISKGTNDKDLSESITYAEQAIAKMTKTVSFFYALREKLDEHPLLSDDRFKKIKTGIPNPKGSVTKIEKLRIIRPAVQLKNFAQRPTYRDRRGFLTDGTYYVSPEGGQKHIPGLSIDGKSEFLSDIDVDQLTILAAQIADSLDLWKRDKSDVQKDSFKYKARIEFEDSIGMDYKSGRPTKVINVYRQRKGLIHGSPGGQND